MAPWLVWLMEKYKIMSGAGFWVTVSKCSGLCDEQESWVCCMFADENVALCGPLANGRVALGAPELFSPAA